MKHQPNAPEFAQALDGSLGSRSMAAMARESIAGEPSQVTNVAIHQDAALL